MFPSTIAIPAPWLASAKLLEVAGCHFGPLRSIAVAGTEIADRPLMAEPLYRDSQFVIFSDELLEVFSGDLQ
jgi:hypothetical protein